jgi:hypothetical protein
MDLKAVVDVVKRKLPRYLLSAAVQELHVAIHLVAFHFVTLCLWDSVCGV